MWLNRTYFKRLIIFIVIIKSSVRYVYSCDIACELVMYGLAKNCWKQETNLQLFINFKNLLHHWPSLVCVACRVLQFWQEWNLNLIFNFPFAFSLLKMQTSTFILLCLKLEILSGKPSQWHNGRGQVSQNQMDLCLKSCYNSVLTNSCVLNSPNIVYVIVIVSS